MLATGQPRVALPVEASPGAAGGPGNECAPSRWLTAGGGNHAWDLPAFVVTYEMPDGWPRPNSTVHFVTDGIESAVAQAKAAVAPKSVGVHGAETIHSA